MVKTLEARQDQEYKRLSIDIAHDRQRIAKLETTDPKECYANFAEKDVSKIFSSCRNIKHLAVHKIKSQTLRI